MNKSELKDFQKTTQWDAAIDLATFYVEIEKIKTDWTLFFCRQREKENYEFTEEQKDDVSRALNFAQMQLLDVAKHQLETSFCYTPNSESNE